MYREAQKHYCRYFHLETNERDSIIKSQDPDVYSNNATASEINRLNQWHIYFRNWVSNWQMGILKDFSTFVRNNINPILSDVTYFLQVAKKMPILSGITEEVLLRAFHVAATKQNIATTFSKLRKTLNVEIVLDSKAGDLYTTLFAHLCRDTYHHLVSVESNSKVASERRHKMLDTIKRLPRDPCFKDITMVSLPFRELNEAQGPQAKKRRYSETTMTQLDPSFKRLSVIGKRTKE